MALPREAREANKINGLRNRLGKNASIVLQGFSELSPKRTRAQACVRADQVCQFIQPGSKAKYTWAGPDEVDVGVLLRVYDL
jgi:hypothetical protein